ncbi:MAG: UvrD-helicase domain-containing protein [Propionibacteriaceae bacterium]|jgi:DNA helicase-2/ATP-dependent DNA helicase PcrA|nr:UvrD-helicase domain-containing protein [Propionibacteriaceae bacterium]
MQTDLLSDLNPEQRAAVVHQGTPVLVVAGAGSGKTRVLTRRIAYLIRERHVDPASVLAITFTNKAAGEMRSRVVDLVGRSANWMWVSTFHSACVRMLRADGDKIGLRRSFTIYDDGDSRRLMGMVLHEMGVDTKQVSPRAVLGWVSTMKNNLVGPVAAAAQAPKFGVGRHNGDAYRQYQERLTAANALDFDDLLFYTELLLREVPSVREAYRRRFRHILVDEYQDTNLAQYELIHHLCAPADRGDPTQVSAPELLVVGDSDQSIYAFRGATIRNILDFERDFPGAETILLERNYRSTQTVLNAANAVISKNIGRPAKNLWTDAAPGDRIEVYAAEDDRDEARWIVQRLSDLAAKRTGSYNETAVMYRTNSQSRLIEDEFVSRGVPYRVIGGVRYYDRREVRDALAYLRAIVNPDDDVSVRRILNTPKRGIGATTEAAIADFARRHQLSFGAACERASDIGLSAAAYQRVREFAALLAEHRTMLADGVVAYDIVASILERSGLLADLRGSTDPQDEGRLENLEQLTALAAEFVAEVNALALDGGLDGEPDGEPSGELYGEPSEGLTERDTPTTTLAPAVDDSLGAFLERIALASDTDQIPDSGEGVVTLLTLHAAKGLEYDDVFIAGWEEGLFPHSRSSDSPDELAEERRLAYVGLTRARKRLHLTFAEKRFTWGTPAYNPLSRFLNDIPEELVKWIRHPHALPDTGYDDSTARRKTSWRARGGAWWESESDTSSEAGRVFGSGGRSELGAGDGFAERERFGQRAASTASRGSTAVLEVGDRVNHATFGLGKVVEVAGKPGEQRVSVDFGSAGIKRLAVQYAPLEKL